MTILSVCQEAAIELNQPEPATLFSTTDQFAKELRTQANRAAKAILKAYDWRALTKLAILTGNGATTSFTLPVDYDRMPVKTSLLSSQFSMPVAPARDLDQWLDYQINPVTSAWGTWIVLNGAVQVMPAISTGTTAKFYYIRNTVVSGGTKTTFTADTDTFDLPERLLTLSIIWRWRAQKRKDYAEDMRNFEIALAEEMSSDKGSRVLVVGRQRMPFDVHVAYPRPLGS